MKHGPNALIDERLPVVVVNPQRGGQQGFGAAVRKTHSNIVEVKAREGVVLSILTEGDQMSSKESNHVIEIPHARTCSPILAVIPLQLLAYHIAVRRGCDVDQPRNLAKSVTVE
jgi:glucosamine--fructose-6-phosphate aminotransferase (isomerizing)